MAYDDDIDLLGLSLQEFGKGFLGGAHVGGRILATAFGGAAGAKLADASESLESPALPDWARSNTAPQDKPSPPDGSAASAPQAVSSGTGAAGTVLAPDFVVIVHTNNKVDPPFQTAGSVFVTGGLRFDGNGYKSGDGYGKKFSFGYNTPSKVDIVVKGGQKVSYTDVKQVIFCGGTENTGTRIAGIEGSDEMDLKNLGDQVLGELADSESWTEIVGEGAPLEMSHSTYLHGTDLLGASAPAVGQPTRVIASNPAKYKATHRAGFTVSKSPYKGRTHVVQQIAKAGKHRPTHEETIKLAKQVSERAIKHAKTLIDRVAQEKKARERMQAAKISGIELAKPGRKLGHPKLPLAAIEKIAHDTLKTGKDLGVVADKHKTRVATWRTAVKNGVKATQRSYGPHGSKGVRVTGFDDYELDEALNQFDILGAPTDPDPLNPGYLIDGSPDPSTGMSVSAADASGTVTSVPGPPDYGLTPPGPDAGKLQPGEYAADPMGPNGINDKTVYKLSTLPDGAVAYDKTLKPWAYKSVGSFTRFNAAGPHYVDGDGPSGFQFGGGDGTIMDGWYWWWEGALSGTQYKHDTGPQPTGANYPPYSAELVTLPDPVARAQASANTGWGPLIGNPSDPDFKSLRYDMGTDQWFWYYDSAPDWAKAAGDMVRYNQALADYQTQLAAAKVNYADEVAQDALSQKNAADAARTNAAEDAAAQHQADLAAINQPIQQAALDQQAAQAELADATQQAALDVQERKQGLDYYAQHPDELYQGDGGMMPDDGIDDGSQYGENQADEDRNLVDDQRDHTDDIPVDSDEG